MTKITIQRMLASGLDYIMLVQSECYTEIELESRSSLESKLRLSPDTCWVAAVGGKISAYLICHNWNIGSVPALDTQILALPENREVFYIHDLAVSSRGRGLGLGRLLVGTALSAAREVGFKRAGLIAVQGSSRFWEKFRFTAATLSSRENEAKLKCYGRSAIYMENCAL